MVETTRSPARVRQRRVSSSLARVPGFHEDRLGRPFVGQAGQLLDEMIDGIGMRRADVFIANVLKCRPPNNRDPLPDEAEACRPYLDQQLELINPDLVVLLGRHALNAFFPEARISRARGRGATAAWPRVSTRLPSSGSAAATAVARHPVAGLPDDSQAAGRRDRGRTPTRRRPTRSNSHSSPNAPNPGTLTMTSESSTKVVRVVSIGGHWRNRQELHRDRVRR